MLKRFKNEIVGERRFRLNQKLVVFLFFVLFSAIIWYLNKLSGEYIVDIKIPIKITYTETDKVLVDEGAPVLKLQVKARGYAILKFKMKQEVPPFLVDISSYRLHHYKHRSDQYFILTTVLKSNLSTQLPPSIRIENINPDSLFFTFSTLYSKKVPVLPSVHLSFEEQFMQVGEIALKPDSVTLSGPKAVLEKVKYIATRPIISEKLNEDLTGKVGLVEPQNVVAANKEVEYGIKVARFTEAKLKLPVHYNSRDSAGVLLIPSNVEVTFRVAVADYSKVQPGLFRLVVDPEETSSLTNNVKVKVVAAPAYISNIRVEPEFVELYNQKR